MELVTKLKKFDINEYSIRLDTKAKEKQFNFLLVAEWLVFKNKALLEVPQSTHRLSFSDLKSLIEKDNKFTCFEVAQIIRCMQELSVKNFVDAPTYIEFLELNEPVLDALQNQYLSFESEIETDLQKDFGATS